MMSKNWVIVTRINRTQKIVFVLTTSLEPDLYPGATEFSEYFT